MLKLGVIGTAAAAYNLHRAKADYEALAEKQSGIQAAMATLSDTIDKYNDTKNDVLLPDWEKIDTKPNDMPAGLQVTTILRTANLVGSLFYTKPSVVMANTSNKPLYILSVKVDCIVLDTYLAMFKTGLKNLSQSVRETNVIEVNRNLEPGEVVELELPTGISSMGDKMGELRTMICTAAGKKLITSCQKLNIDNGQKSCIMLDWVELDADGKRTSGNNKTAYWINKPGVLRYCGEAGLK